MVGRKRPQSNHDTAVIQPPHEPAASAARRATADPSVFLIPEAHLPPGFAEKVEHGGFAPAAPRPAATVVLMRDADAGAEVLLLRRHRRSGFAADAWVFPGGVVDAGDRDNAVLARLDGPSPAAWAARLGIAAPAEAAGYVVAAIREAFEETGILLADAPEGGPAGADPARWRETARRALLEEVIGMRELVTSHLLRLRGDGVAYLAHWITPEPEPRRYDTRFFLARVAAGAECVVHDAEMTDAAWLPAAEGAARFARGEMKMLPPTVHTLRRIAAYGTADEALAALRDAPVHPILPAMRRHPEGVAIELPPEAGA
jgi:8-oxo-dGTP pyrophosphatase MutT (NUDIX family)